MTHRIPSPARRAATAAYDAIERLAHKRFERRFAADVGGHDYLGDAGIASDGNTFYEGTPELATELAFRRLRLTPDDVFVDLGCGKGSALLLAGEHPIRRVIGVELGEDLAEEARRNLAANAARLRARATEVHAGDVLAWDVPDDLTVVFMYCPFLGEVFDAAMQRIFAAYDARPRPLRIAYNYPWEHNRLIATGRVRVVDVAPGDLRLRPGWWRRAETIVVYQVLGADGSALPVPRPRRVNPRALEYWNAPNDTRYMLERPGVPTLYSHPD